MKRVILGVLAIAAACEPLDNAVVVTEHPTLAVLTGTWVGRSEITTAENIGTGGSQSPAFVFNVLLQLRSDGRFELVVSNYPASWTDEGDRTCLGAWERQGNTLELFPFQACRPLPFTKYRIGRTLPAGLTLDASTAFSPSHSPATIRARMTLDRT